MAYKYAHTRKINTYVDLSIDDLVEEETSRIKNGILVSYFIKRHKENNPTPSEKTLGEYAKMAKRHKTALDTIHALPQWKAAGRKPRAVGDVKKELDLEMAKSEQDKTRASKKKQKK